MKAIKNLGYAALTALTLGTAAYQTKAQDESIKDKGLSFYEYNDKNNNGIVDAGESSKLERVVFEEGENVAIDSKFKSGTGKLYVISEIGKIMKEIPQQYETGVKTPQLLEGLPKGKYTTVFQKDGSQELNGSFMGIVGKGEEKKLKFQNELQEKKFSDTKPFLLAIGHDWNDLNKDGKLDPWEFSSLDFSRNTNRIMYIKEGAPLSVLYRGKIILPLELKKKGDRSFKKQKDLLSRTKGKILKKRYSNLTKGTYQFKIGFGPITVIVE